MTENFLVAKHFRFPMFFPELVIVWIYKEKSVKRSEYPMEVDFVCESSAYRGTANKLILRTAMVAVRNYQVGFGIQIAATVIILVTTLGFKLRPVRNASSLVKRFSVKLLTT